MAHANTQFGAKRKYNPIAVIAVVVILLLLISSWAQWYGQQVSIPRYCGNIVQTIKQVEQLLLNGEAIDQDQRRSYLISAKLLFLIPQLSAEPTQDYLQRIELELRDRCP